MPTPEQPYPLSQKEKNFIEQNARGPIYVSGLLVVMRREGLTLDQVYNDALSQPDQEEHHPALGRARDFLAEHAYRFGIVVSEGEKPSTDSN